MIIYPKEMLKIFMFGTMSSFILAYVFDMPKTIVDKAGLKCKSVFLTINDFFSVISFSVLIILMTYYNNDGVFRWIYMSSIITGIFTYHTLFAKFSRKLTVILLFPVFLSAKLIRKIYVFFIYGIEKIYLKLYNNRKDPKL